MIRNVPAQGFWFELPCDFHMFHRFGKFVEGCCLLFVVASEGAGMAEYKAVSDSGTVFLSSAAGIKLRSRVGTRR